jgi:hypothetical protein
MLLLVFEFGRNKKKEVELMWIARQGVMAPLPKGWKPVQDPNGELYYFNFETGESIWDHPCDEDFKKLVVQERKVLMEKGKDNYRIPDEYLRQSSPTKMLSTTKSPASTLKNTGTTKSTSTSVSELLQNGKLSNQQQHESRFNLRKEFENFDTRELGNVEFEEEDELELDELDQSKKKKVPSMPNLIRDNEANNEDDEESEPSWQKKSGSDDSSDGFRKPIDFGIDKETSLNLDKLNMLLISNKEPSNNQNRVSVESMPSTSRESPTKQIKSIGREDIKGKDYEKELKLFQESLEREFDQKRLELLENKDLKVNKLKQEIDSDLKHFKEAEYKRLQREQEDKLK